MKKIAIIACSTLLFLVCFRQVSFSEDPVEAYNNAIRAYDEATQQLQRSNLRSQKKEIVKQALALTSEEARDFWPVYNKYEEDFAKINDKRLALITDYLDHKNDLSPEKAAELINRLMQVQDERHEMKRSYLKDLGKVLTARQTLRLMILENQMDLQIDAQIAAQIPL